MSAQIEIEAARGRLAKLWLGGASAIGVLLLAQTVAGKYGGQTERAWGWFLPTVMPTLTVIVTAWFATNAPRTQTVDASAFRMAFGLSLGYVLLVAATLLLQPLSAQPPLEFVTSSHLWLAPTQALVGIGVGRFFAAKPLD